MISFVFRSAARRTPNIISKTITPPKIAAPASEPNKPSIKVGSIVIYSNPYPSSYVPCKRTSPSPFKSRIQRPSIHSITPASVSNSTAHTAIVTLLSAISYALTSISTDSPCFNSPLISNSSE